MSISPGFREWECPKSGDAHITVTPGLSRHRGPLDNEPEDNIQGFRLFSLCIYSLLLVSH